MIKTGQIKNQIMKNYEEYMIDKTLVKKLTSVKSTIKNQNDNFVR